MFQVKDNAIGNIKYVGIARAVVIDNNDPLKRGRIRVNTPVLGETNWIPYLTTPGTFNVPDVDSVVYVQCDGGFYTHPVAWGNLNYGDDGDLQFPEEFQRVSPTNRGWYTPVGHLIEVDDGTDEAGTGRGIRITTADKTIINIADEPTDHSVTVTFDAGLEIVASGTEDSVTIDTNNGEHVEISKLEGIQLSTPDNGGTSASFKAGKIDIEANSDITLTSDTGTYTLDINGDITYSTDTGNFKITASAGDVELEASGGAKLKLSAGKVGLGISSAEIVALLESTLTQFSATLDAIALITVPTAVGPSGVPVNASQFTSVIKTAVTNIKTLVTSIKGGV